MLKGFLISLLLANLVLIQASGVFPGSTMIIPHNDAGNTEASGEARLQKSKFLLSEIVKNGFPSFRLTYDDTGRLLKTEGLIDSYSNISTLEYNGDGQLTRVTRGGNYHGFSHNADGKVLIDSMFTVFNGNYSFKSSLKYDYDSLGRISRKTNDDGSYDAFYYRGENMVGKYNKQPKRKRESREIAYEGFDKGSNPFYDVKELTYVLDEVFSKNNHSKRMDEMTVLTPEYALDNYEYKYNSLGYPVEVNIRTLTNSGQSVTNTVLKFNYILIKGKE